MQSIIEEVLTFWFGPIESPDYGTNRPIWWQSSQEFDSIILQKFKPIYEEALEGVYDHLEETPEGILTLIILYDQFARNMFRGSSRMYATDEKALALAKKAIQEGFDKRLDPIMRMFLYMPFQHSEDIDIQKKSVELFADLGDDAATSAIAHCEVINRFGRFPHRNGILGRDATDEEVDFLHHNPRGF